MRARNGIRIRTALKLAALAVLCVAAWSFGATQGQRAHGGDRLERTSHAVPAPARALAPTPAVFDGATAGRGDASAVESHDSSDSSPRFFPRDPNEWQGMLVDVSDLQEFCRGAADCGLALGCKGGSAGCGPCTGDAQCASEETCVLDHCVLRDRVRCRSYRDCGGQVPCLLSGISDGPRGNADMQALCASDLRNRPEPPVPVPDPNQPKYPQPGMSYDTLHQLLEQSASGAQVQL